MLQFLKIFFKPKPNLRKLIEEGAVIIDVRTPREYASGTYKRLKKHSAK